MPHNWNELNYSHEARKNSHLGNTLDPQYSSEVIETLVLRIK